MVRPAWAHFWVEAVLYVDHRERSAFLYSLIANRPTRGIIPISAKNLNSASAAWHWIWKRLQPVPVN